MTTYKETLGLDAKFNAFEIESRCMNYWEKAHTYTFNQNVPRAKIFAIDTPPPTVSGSLHIGHIFSYTQTDIVARYQRMNGKEVFYPIGWDDNGLPTERRVQNYYHVTCNPDLAYDPDFVPSHTSKAEGERTQISRKNFIETCAKLTEMDEKAFEDIFHRIGHSYDWDLKYSTISPLAIKESQKSFLDLVKKGWVRLEEAPTMWDETWTAIAQAEIEDREVAGFFHDIRFRVAGEEDTCFTIATTRPEFLPACIAVVAHPDDERYQKYFGKKALVPLFDIEVPIVPSEHAEIDKGTGIMMVCTFGDAADVAWWKQSGLPIKQIIGQNGRLLDITYGQGAFTSRNPEKARAMYAHVAGQRIKKARQIMVDLLRESGDLLAEPRPITHPVKFYEKGDTPLEFVTTRQWFVSTLPYKKELIDMGRKINWIPKHMQIRYEAWVDGLNQDWCISRQRYFGVPFPVWYPLDEKGNIDYHNPIFAEENRLPIDPMTDVPTGYTEAQRGKPCGFVGDKDVMDTWATSSLTPQIALALLKGDHQLSLPFDVRPQAHDIIRTWAFYTILKAYAHEGVEPWKNAFISGFILDPDRKKMSKSKGNVVTPIDLLEKHSSDAVRYWAGRAKLGIDMAFEEQVMEQGRKLALKFFNASKFVYMIYDKSGLNLKPDYQALITNPLDKSWVAVLQETAQNAHKAFGNTDYAFALEHIEKCFWSFCDNYLEIVKGRAYGEDPTSAIATLMFTIDTLTRLFAPFLVFITEEIWQTRPWAKDITSVHRAPYPSGQEVLMDTDTTLYTQVCQIVDVIRKEKATHQKSLKTPIVSLELLGPASIGKSLETAQEDIKAVGNIQTLTFKENESLHVNTCVFGEAT